MLEAFLTAAMPYQLLPGVCASTGQVKGMMARIFIALSEPVLP
jgi:hypothetical protein